MMTTRLSPEAFLPSGAFDSDTTSPLNNNLPYCNVSNIPSPPDSYPRPGTLRHQYPQHYLTQCQNYSQTYSHGPPQRGQIPPASTLPLHQSDNSYPLSLASLRAAQSAPHHQSSACLHPDVVSDRWTNNTCPATVPAYGGPPVNGQGQRLSHSSLAPLPSAPAHLVGASLSRSVSADAVAPSPTSLHVVQRLVQQNTLIRDAWEAERKYLEANRRRAEEVYQEERVIMDEVRDGWEAEKSAMLREIGDLKERVYRLEGENKALKVVTSQNIQATGVVSPLASQRGGSSDTAMESSYFSAPAGHLTSRSQKPPIPTSLSLNDASCLPPGLDGASRRPHFFSSGSSRVSPTTQPDSSPFIPLDPRMQPQTSGARDFMASPTDDVATPVPVIDVQEIDPKLEGIPIKATAVKRTTFTATGSPESATSPATSPPRAAPTGPENHDHPATARSSSKEYTLQALSVPDSRRLTMHAGHTPNHSLSLFPNVNPANPAEAITIVGEGATPIVEKVVALQTPVAFQPEALGVPEQSDRRDSKVSLLTEDSMDLLMEAEDDKPLKGPLMIRNMPAKDEIFWEAVNKKLEPISQGQNALPAVMQSRAGPSLLTGALHKLGAAHESVGGDGSNDANDDDGESDGESKPKSKRPHADVPLKFKSTSNFGAPFGAM